MFKQIIAHVFFLALGFPNFQSMTRKSYLWAGGWQCYSPGIERLSGRQSFMWLSQKKQNQIQQQLLCYCFLFVFCWTLWWAFSLKSFEIVFFHIVCSKVWQENLICSRRMTVLQSRDWDIVREAIFHVAVSKKQNQIQQQICFQIGSAWIWEIPL